MKVLLDVESFVGQVYFGQCEGMIDLDVLPQIGDHVDFGGPGLPLRVEARTLYPPGHPYLALITFDHVVLDSQSQAEQMAARLTETWKLTHWPAQPGP